MDNSTIQAEAAAYLEQLGHVVALKDLLTGHTLGGVLSAASAANFSDAAQGSAPEAYAQHVCILLEASKRLQEEVRDDLCQIKPAFLHSSHLADFTSPSTYNDTPYNVLVVQEGCVAGRGWCMEACMAGCLLTAGIGAQALQRIDFCRDKLAQAAQQEEYTRMLQTPSATDSLAILRRNRDKLESMLKVRPLPLASSQPAQCCLHE